MLQQAIEQAVARERFGMKPLHEAALPILNGDSSFADPLARLEERLGGVAYKKLVKAVLRHAFLIELVKLPGVETTKMRARWDSQLGGDPRECSFDDCRVIALKLITDLVGGWLDTNDNEEALRLFLENQLLSYEAPIDYIAIDASKMHRPDNIQLPRFSLLRQDTEAARLRQGRNAQPRRPVLSSGSQGQDRHQDVFDGSGSDWTPPDEPREALGGSSRLRSVCPSQDLSGSRDDACRAAVSIRRIPPRTSAGASKRRAVDGD